MKQPFPPWMLPYQNTMDEFMQSYRRKQGLPDEAEAESRADRLFIESGNKLIAAHRANKKRFSWAGLFGFLVLAVLVGALTYLFVGGV